LTKKHLKLLEDYRNETRKNFSSLDTSNLTLDNLSLAEDALIEFSSSVFKLSQKCSDDFISICSKFIQSSVKSLDALGSNVPCSFAIIGLGSVARGTATPYSDLEYAFVIDSDAHIDYFTKLAVDSYFRIGNMNESPLKGFNIPEIGKSYTDSASVGFRIDGISKNAGNIPTGKGDGSRGLILTVEQLTELYSKTLTSPAGDIADAADLLSSVVMICSYKNGEILFDKTLENFHAILAQNVNNSVVVNKRLKLLKTDVKSYNFLPTFKSFGPPANAKLRVKSDIFRYPTLLVDHLRLLIALDKLTPWSITYHLKQQNIVTEKQMFRLNLISALSIYIRTTAYLQSKTQQDHLSLYPPTECHTKGIYHVSRSMFVLLAYLIVPVKTAVQKKLDTIDCQNEWETFAVLKTLLQQVALYNPGFTLRMEVEFFCGDFEQSIKSFKTNCGADIFDKSPKDFGETIGCSNYSDASVLAQHCKYKDNVSTAPSKYIEMAAYLLYSSRKYDSCFKYFTWLAENCVDSASDRLKWKVLAADSANQLHNYHEVFSLIGEVLSTIKSKYKLDSSQTLYRFVREQAKQAEHIADDIDIFEIVSQAFRVTSKAYQNVKDYVQAEELANAALTLFDSLYSQRSGQLVGSHYADLIVSLALLQSERGEYDKGLKYLIHHLNKLKEVHTDQTNHPDIALLLSGLGQLYKKAENYESSLDFYGRALAMTKSLYNSDHAVVAQCYQEIAAVHAKIGDYSSAFNNYQIAEQLFDSLEVDVHEKASLLVEIGLLYCCKSEYNSALSYLDLALSIMKCKVVNTHIDMADINSAYGKVYSEKGQTELALKHHTKSLEITKEVLSSIDNIALFVQLHGDMGKFSVKLSAEAMMLNIERASKEVNSVSPDVASCYMRVGCVYQDMCLHEQSLLYFNKACEILRTVYGSDAMHADIASSYTKIGDVYRGMSEYSKALQYYRNSLEMQLAVYGSDAVHADIARSYTNIGNVYRNMSEYSKAIEYYKSGLEMQLAVYGSDAVHADIASSYINIGSVYRNMNEYSNALEYYRKSLEMRLAVYGSDAVHARIAGSYNNIGSVYRNMGDYSNALKYHKKGLEMQLAVFGCDGVHASIANSYNNIGLVYSDIGEYSKALEYHRRSLEMQLAAYGSDAMHALIANSYCNIASVHHKLSNYTSSLHCYTKCKYMCKEIYGADANHKYIDSCYRGIADVYTDAGEYTKSLHYLTLSLDMTKAIHGDNTTHKYIADAFHKLGKLYHNTGQYTHSVHCFNVALAQRNKRITVHLSLYTTVLVSLSQTIIATSDYKHAKGLLLLTLKQVPTDYCKDTRANIFQLLGQCCLHLHQYRKCWEYLYSALCYYESLPSSNWKINCLARVYLYISYMLLHLGHVSQAIENSEFALDLVENAKANKDNMTPEFTRLYDNIKFMVLGSYSALTLYADL